MAVVAIGIYVLLENRPARETSVDMLAEDRSDSSGLPEAELAGRMAASDQARKLPEEEKEQPSGWTSDKKGALTYFDLAYGEIGYVDVNALMRDRDPYSVVSLLQDHYDLTGAGEWLELDAGATKENKIWGYRTRFTQLIGGIPTQWGGTVLFSPDGTVGVVHGDLVNPEALLANNAIVLRPEAESIAYGAAVGYAEDLPLVANVPELHRQQLRIDVLPVERFREMRYELAPNNELRRLWRVGIGIRGPKRDTVERPFHYEVQRVI